MLDKTTAVLLLRISSGVLVEFLQLPCPLTQMENRFKQLGGEQGYEGGFVEYYVSAILYAPITPQFQMTLGLVLILLNILVYFYVFQRTRHLT